MELSAGKTRYDLSVLAVGFNVSSTVSLVFGVIEIICNLEQLLFG